MKNDSRRNFLKEAKQNKNDEFYTQMKDIESELLYYKSHFKNKVIFCNCDDPLVSNFYKYFALNFEELGIKKIISACYCKDDNGYYYEYSGSDKENRFPSSDDLISFEGTGDFRSDESIELLKKSDVIITNPPFSLFRDFISLLVEYDKLFLTIGSINCITYKEIFKLIKSNHAWLGVNLGRGISGFIVPDHYNLYGTETSIDEFGNKIVSPNNCLWLTNLDNFKRHDNIPLVEKYYGNEQYFPIYDNYNAININRTKEIPSDYNGIMGVPITFLHKFNPEQFIIIKFRKGVDGKDLSIQGKNPYFRILIKRR